MSIHLYLRSVCRFHGLLVQHRPVAGRHRLGNAGSAHSDILGRDVAVCAIVNSQTEPHHPANWMSSTVTGRTRRFNVSLTDRVLCQTGNPHADARTRRPFFDGEREAARLQATPTERIVAPLAAGGSLDKCSLIYETLCHYGTIAALAPEDCPKYCNYSNLSKPLRNVG